jgi:DUF3089 family protein
MISWRMQLRKWRMSAASICVGFALLSTAALTAPAAASTLREAGTAAPSNTVWLCRPGMANDPCASSLATSSVSSNGTVTPVAAKPASKSKFDCFFVYPTVSGELTQNSNLKIQPAEIVAAQVEAARFSQVCQVWAPMYRQRTELSLLQGLGNDKKVGQIAYNSLLSGWKDYLAHDNHGRPIVFIGHSQGAAILIQLLRTQIDPSPKLRARMVSAIILGGNVQVPTGGTVGGSFKDIPTCQKATQTGCVIAYSTFGSQPPATALFTRPGEGVSLQSGQTTSAGQQVVCVNPVTFAGGPSTLTPYFLSAGSVVTGVKITTPWVTYPGLYTATCKSADGATWLQINAAAVAGDPRPKITATLGPNWGYHLSDVSLALGNLVFDVAIEESAFH